mgnify:CR=1 FL=1
MAIYNDIATVIGNGGYDLADLLHRIDVIYVSGKLTDAEREDLYVLARAGAKPEDSLAPVVQRVEALEAWRTEVDAKLAELSGSGEDPDPEEPADEWPEYVQPTGAHDAYWRDDKVTWQGGHYICTAPEGVACVWDPGTYPAYWEKQE